MKKLRAFNIVNLTFNLVIIILSVGALILLFFDLGFSCFNYFSSWACLLGGAIGVIAVVYNCLKEIYKQYKIHISISILKLMNVVNLMICLLGCLAFIGPSSLFESYFFIPRLILPIVALLNFVLFDFAHKMSFKHVLFVILPVFVYIAVICFMYIFDLVPILYNFENIFANAWYITLIFIIIILVGSLFMGYIINKINHGFRRVFIKKEDEVEDTPEIPKLEETKTETKKDTKASKKTTKEKEEKITSTLEKPISSYQKKFTARVYHISKQRAINQWQVKLAGGEKAIKYFNTQQEAIDYAKELVAKNGGSIRIHSLTGQMRKD